jgi:ubiquinone/menaquinone biosynthesis C-methylase UbiE
MAVVEPVRSLTIPARFCGPPASANGGYTCGRLATWLGGSAEVTLKRPPPLEIELEVNASADRAVLLEGEAVIAEARRATLDVSLPAPVTVAAAEEAARQYRWRDGHPYPTCFVCGPQRALGDGLRIFAGQVRGRNVVAAPWVPPDSMAQADASMPPEVVWAALDCPGAFAFPEHVEGRAVLLGRMTADLVAPVLAGRPHVVVGWPIAAEGRKLRVGTAIFTAAGHLRAISTAIWIRDAPPEGGIATISSIAYGFMASQALFSALELDLFTALDPEPLAAADLAAHLGVEPEPLESLVNALVGLELLNAEGARVANTHSASRYLVRTSRAYVGDYYLKQVARILYPAVRRASAVLRGGRIADTYARFLRDPRRADQFIRGQHAGSVGPGYLLAKAVDLSSARHLLDLGGGSGAMAIEIARRNPTLTATVVDYPSVVAVARRIIAESGLSDRIAVLEGDLRSVDWPTADVVLLSYVISSYRPKELQSLLVRITRHLDAGGRVLIHDFALEADRLGPRNTALWFFANLVISAETHAYTVSELLEAMEVAGLTEVSAQPHIPNVTYLLTGRRIR